ncbi:MAG: YihY/virulence factor BrkB family protein [Acidobacteriota bacterium]|nr:YihY/virulence factor BrkB family protein [Acidobacteriota bacterium]
MPILPSTSDPTSSQASSHDSSAAGVAHGAHPHERMIWDYVSLRPLHSLWDLQGVPLRLIAKRTWNSLMNDNLFGSAAELGYWFLFALFPTLVSASSIIGLAARGARDNYGDLLHYMSLVVPPSAYGIVLETFNQITTKSTGRKVTIGLAAALWAASAGFSAIQDSMNAVYKVKETRPYWKVKGLAVLISTVLSLLVTAILASLLAGDFVGRIVAKRMENHALASAAVVGSRAVGWTLATALLALLFAMIYYWGPDLKNKKWRWLTPGAAIGILGWALASVGLRIYLHYFNNYSATYGSLGAVIILLTWFYLSGLMLLIGAEVNSEIEAAATEMRIAQVAPEQLSREAAGAAARPAADARPAA